MIFFSASIGMVTPSNARASAHASFINVVNHTSGGRGGFFGRSGADSDGFGRLTCPNSHRSKGLGGKLHIKTVPSGRRRIRVHRVPLRRALCRIRTATPAVLWLGVCPVSTLSAQTPVSTEVSVHEAYAELPGARIFYRDTGGSGVPVIFLHAATGSSRVWDYQIPAFR